MSRHRHVEAPKRAMFEAPEPTPAPDWFDEWDTEDQAQDEIEQPQRDNEAVT